jgi:hypothetical protein
VQLDPTPSGRFPGCAGFNYARLVRMTEKLSMDWMSGRSSTTQFRVRPCKGLPETISSRPNCPLSKVTDTESECGNKLRSPRNARILSVCGCAPSRKRSLTAIAALAGKCRSNRGTAAMQTMKSAVRPIAATAK